MAVNPLADLLKGLIDDTSSNDEDVYLSGNISRLELKAICEELALARAARPLIIDLAAWERDPDRFAGDLANIANRLGSLVQEG